MCIGLIGLAGVKLGVHASLMPMIAYLSVTKGAASFVCVFYPLLIIARGLVGWLNAYRVAIWTTLALSPACLHVLRAYFASCIWRGCLQ